MSAHRIRLARLHELDRLAEIERAAAVRFEPWGLAEVMGAAVTPREALEAGVRNRSLFVGVAEDDVPVGFALGALVDDDAHLVELDVLPEHGRRGLGRALVVAVLAWGVALKRKRITLSTLSFVPFNAPFYEKLGFVPLGAAEVGLELSAMCALDAERGLPSDGRVLLQRRLPTDIEDPQTGEVG